MNSITIIDSNHHTAECGEWCAVRHCQHCRRPAVQGLAECGHHAFTTQAERDERGALGDAVAVLGSLVGIIALGVFLVLTSIGKAEAAEPVSHQTVISYDACTIGPDPVNCTWDGIDNGTVGTRNYWISPNPDQWVWPLPHHIAHLIIGWEYPPRTEYMPCATDEGADGQHNCVWDARHQGNGMGMSMFVGKGGKVWPLPHHIAHYLTHPH